MEHYRIRREIKEYFEKSNTQFSFSFWEKITILIFTKKITRIKTGSPKWHHFQDKVSLLTTDGLGNIKRNIFYKLTLKECGDALLIYPLTSIHFPQNLKIGNGVKLNRGVFITATTDIEIGSNVMIGPYSVINSANHIYEDSNKLIEEQGHKIGKIIIEDDVWIGSNVSVLAGVTIGQGSVIGAGAVVNKSIPRYSVAAGVPAVIIKKR